MNNVDDTKTIETFDKFNMRKLLHEFPYQGEKMIELMKNVNIPSEYKNVKNIIVSGLGGSSVGGDLLKNFLRDKINLPLMVNRSYTLPRWVGEDTLLICVSYSGNTEETLSAYRIAKEAKSKIIVISSGGELTALARQDGFVCIPVPEVGISPRAALGYLFFPQLLVIKILGFADINNSEVSEAIQTLKDLREEIDIDIPKDKNISKKLAEAIYQTIPLVYTTSDYFEGAGVRWKTQINENSKSPVYCELFSELNHNEIMGWEGGKDLVRKFSLILLRDKGEPERMQKRINITLAILKDKASQILEVQSRGNNLLSRILSLVYIGDYVSFYLAVLNEVDPTEIKSILSLKESLSK